MQSSSEAKKITSGFILSVVAGILVLINGILWFVVLHVPIAVPEEAAISEQMISTTMIFSLLFIILGSIGVLFAIAILIGALFIYMYGNKPTGGKIVLVFSILSIATGGGILIGMIIGIVGGAYGIKKK